MAVSSHSLICLFLFFLFKIILKHFSSQNPTMAAHLTQTKVNILPMLRRFYGGILTPPTSVSCSPRWSPLTGRTEHLSIPETCQIQFA